MEKVPPDQLRIAKDNLDISILDVISLKTISSRLVKGLKKTPEQWEINVEILNNVHILFF